MEKREEKPKRNLKKGLTKPKTRHQRSVKKRKRDLKSQQKKRTGFHDTEMHPWLRKLIFPAVGAF